MSYPPSAALSAKEATNVMVFALAALPIFLDFDQNGI